MSGWIPSLLLLAAFVMAVGVIHLRGQQRQLRRLLRDHEREHRAVMDFLTHMGAQFRSRLEQDQILESILKFVTDATDARAGAVFLLDAEEREALHARIVEGLFPPLHPVPDKVFARHQFLTEKLKKEKVRLGEGLVGTVAAERKPLLIVEAASDPRIPPSANSIVPVETLMASPLLARGELLGVIVLLNRRTEGAVFSPSDLRLLTALADQAAIAVDLAMLYRELSEKERLEQELSLARSLQQMLLPRSFPPIAGLQIAAYSEPALEVGGDYYDIFEVDEEHVGIAVADVSGKGIPGAMVMATVRSTLRAEARNDHSPRAVLERLNARLRTDTSANVFVTMTYGVLSRSRLRLRFARAGHEPLIVCGTDASQQPRLYSPNGIALGLVDDVMFRVTEEGELQLHDQEVLILYTDGVVEAMNKAHEEYGAERFLETLRGHASDSPEDIVEAVNADLRRFTRGIKQHDDITLVVLKALYAKENSAHVTSGRQIARA